MLATNYGRSRRANLYRAAMVRLLLALLALLTGVAAQLAPAQARGCAVAGTEIGAVAGERSVRPCAVLAAFEHIVASPDRIRPDDRAAKVGLVQQAVTVPTVFQGVDRARE